MPPLPPANVDDAPIGRARQDGTGRNEPPRICAPSARCSPRSVKCGALRMRSAPPFGLGVRSFAIQEWREVAAGPCAGEARGRMAVRRAGATMVGRTPPQPVSTRARRRSSPTAGSGKNALDQRRDPLQLPVPPGAAVGQPDGPAQLPGSRRSHASRRRCAPIHQTGGHATAATAGNGALTNLR